LGTEAVSFGSGFFFSETPYSEKTFAERDGQALPGGQK
jgi:hypothetical protein